MRLTTEEQSQEGTVNAERGWHYTRFVFEPASCLVGGAESEARSTAGERLPRG